MKAGVMAVLGLWMLGSRGAAEPEPFPQFACPRALTRGPSDHFLASCFAINSWSSDGRYALVLEYVMDVLNEKKGDDR